MNNQTKPELLSQESAELFLMRQDLSDAMNRIRQLELEVETLRHLDLRRGNIVKGRRFVQSLLKSPAMKTPLLWSAARVQRASKNNYHSGPIVATRRMCIFAHFDPIDVVRPHVFHYLESLKAAGYDIVFVTSTNGLRRSDLRYLKNLCYIVFRRWNVGMDFGSWQTAFTRLVGVERLEYLILANDSVFGPIHALTPLIRRMEEGAEDFFGLTDSEQIEWHLQSYFLLLKGEVVRSTAFRRFFAESFAGLDKSGIIRQGEIGFSRTLTGAGYSGRALFPYEEVGDPGPYHNPTHAYWNRLIESGYPFLKVELLRDNPTKVPNVGEFRNVLAGTEYPLSMIDKYFSSGATR